MVLKLKISNKATYWTFVVCCSDDQWFSFSQILKENSFEVDHFYLYLPTKPNQSGNRYTSKVENVIIAYFPQHNEAHFNFQPTENRGNLFISEKKFPPRKDINNKVCLF